MFSLVTSHAEEALRDLSGTAWQLSIIQSMDDSTAQPAVGNVYTLVFGIDGSVSVQADCNQLTAPLRVFNPPSLEFGKFGPAQAECGPQSLGERYLRELGWVRSYVYHNGQLHLATMADGSILAFDPLVGPAVTARVLSLSLAVTDADALRSIALTYLLEDYARREGIAVSAEETDAYIAGMDERMRAELGDDYEDASTLPDAERAAVDSMRRSMAESLLRTRQVNARLYGRYGGRVIYQQLGPEPLDAYAAFLRDARKEGSFEIHDAALEAAFWAFFDATERHEFMPDDEAARAFTTVSPPGATD